MLNFENLKKQAKQLVRWHREKYYPVAQRIRTVLPRFRDLDDNGLLAAPFALADAQELIARELGFDSWKALRLATEGTPSPHEQVKDEEPHLLGAFPQLFVADVEASCRFFVETLGFSVRYQYGQPPFYALIERDGARLNLRFVHRPVLLQDPGTDNEWERDLLAASIPVDNVKALFVEYKAAAAPMHQILKTQPWGLRDFIVRDPDGNLIHFAEQAAA